MLKNKPIFLKLTKEYLFFLNYLLTLFNNLPQSYLAASNFFLIVQNRYHLVNKLSFVNNKLPVNQRYSVTNNYLSLNPALKIRHQDFDDCNYDINHKSNLFTNKFKFSRITILNLFFFFNYSYFGSQFTFKSDYGLFYLKNNKNNLIIFDLNKFFSRWYDAYNLLFNVFYYNLNPILLGSPLFKNEILSLNWQYSNFDINLWRYYLPFFIFKSNKYSTKVSFFFDRLSMLDINAFLVTDCHYHYKNLHYLKKKKFYSIALIDVYTNPWITDYPILSFFESLLNQAFFFKLLIFIERQVLFFKYTLSKNYWYKFIYLNKTTFLQK